MTQLSIIYRDHINYWDSYPFSSKETTLFENVKDKFKFWEHYIGKEGIVLEIVGLKLIISHKIISEKYTGLKSLK